MSIQTVIDRASQIEFTRNRLSGQTISRSGRVKTSTIASAVPFQFTVSMAPGLRYSQNRALTEELDRLGRVFTESVNIGDTNPGLAYITEYQGNLSAAALGQITVSSASNLTITLDMTSVAGTGPGTVMFRAGDFIQLDNGYKYPYTVTDDVLRGSDDTVEVPINRPFISQSGYNTNGAGLVVGTDVTWQVVMTNKPSYRIVPGDLLEFSGNFELIEVID